MKSKNLQRSLIEGDKANKLEEYNKKLLNRQRACWLMPINRIKLIRGKFGLLLAFFVAADCQSDCCVHPTPWNTNPNPNMG